MYVVVGQSSALRFVMNEYLNAEIARGLWWFMLSLLGGVAICFVIFSYIFERRLQMRVTKPISELSKQIKNPKEFMAARNKAVDFYARKNTVHARYSTAGSENRRPSIAVSNEQDSTLDTDGNINSSRPLDPSSRNRRESSIGGTKVSRMMSRNF